ncbi:hypothetical protein C6N75_26620, partial [Streptomyces solincola]
PWHTGLGDALLRGLVFALPGLAYLLGGPLAAGPPGRHGLPAGTVPLIAAAVTGWMWNQALAHRAYAWLGLGDRQAAARALLLGAPAGALAGTAAACLAAGPGEWGGAAFAAGQCLYLAAATVLLVLGRPAALLAALAPLVAATPLAYAAELPGAARTAVLLGCLATAAALAVRALRPGGAWPSAGPRGRAAPRRADCLPYALFGLGTGSLVLYAAIGDLLAGGGPARTALGLVDAAALTLSMGPAEWLLHRFRDAGTAGLRAATAPAAFRRATAGVLAGCLGAYLTVLALLAALGSLAVPAAGGPPATRLAALLLLGTVLWSALLLQSFGAVVPAALVCAAAAATQTAAPALGAGDPHTVAAGSTGAAALLLAVLGCALLGRATAHRR